VFVGLEKVMPNLNLSVRRLFKGGSIVFLGLAIDFLVSFLGIVAISRYLGTVDYGTVSLGIVLVGTLVRVVPLGVDKGVARYLPRYDDAGERRGVILSGLHITILSTAVVTVATLLAAPYAARHIFDDPSVAPVLQLFAAVTPFAIAIQFSTSVVQGQSRTVPRVLIQNIIEPLSRVTLILVVVVSGFGVIGGAIAYTLPFVFAGSAGLYYLWQHSSVFDRVKPDYIHRELLLFSAPLAVSASMWFVFTDIDTFFIGYYLGTGDVGIYNVVYSLAAILTMVKTAFDWLTLPILSEHHSNGEYDEMKRLYQTLTKWNFLGTYPALLAFLFVPEAVIWTTFGNEYVPGTSALVVLSLAFATHVFAGPNTSVLTSVGNTQLLMYDAIATAAVNIILNIILIPEYGIVGAAAATTISYTLLNLLVSGQLYQRTGIYPFHRQIPVVAVLSIGLFFGIKTAISQVVPIRSYPGAILLAIGFCSLYGFLLLLFATDENERHIVHSIEDRFDTDLSLLHRIIDLSLI
jgi:O-antigen/teichoic acid export membrane protein